MIKTNKLFNILCIIASFIYIVIIGLLFFMSIFTTSAITIDPITEYTYYLRDNVIKNIIIIAFFILLLFVVCRSKFVINIINKINSDNELFIKIKKVSLIIIFALCAIFVLSGRFFSEADQYSVQSISGQILKGDFSSLNKGGYLERYPFQIGLVLISSVFSLIFGADNYIVLGLVNSLLIMLFYKELSEIISEFKSSNSIQLCIIFSAFLFPVLIFYSYFIYGTIPGATLSLIAFKYEIKYFKDNSNKYLLISFISILFAQLFKTNYIIFAIAMIIYSILKIIQNRNINKIIISVVICISIIIQSILPTAILELASGKKIGRGISPFAYIAMSMQDGDRAPGWYNGYNNDTYDLSLFDTEKQKKLAIDDIKERIAYFNNNRGKLIDFYSKKISSMWNNPSFQCFWNLQRKIPKKEIESRPSWLLWLVDKDGSYQVAKIYNIMMSIIYFGALIFGISLLSKRKNLELLFFAIYFIGGFIFQMLWEGKAQYTFIYFIMLIPLSIFGYKYFTENILKIDVNTTTIIGYCVIILVLLLYIIGMNKYINYDNDNYYSYVYYTVEENKYGGE